ncbi:MAG: hypothetical protein ABIO70_21000 [Pseudomonadota bacterium]
MRALVPLLVLFGQACGPTSIEEPPGVGHGGAKVAGDGAGRSRAMGGSPAGAVQPAHAASLVRAEALLATWAQLPSPELLQQAVEAASVEVREDERQDYARFLLAYLQHLQGQEDLSNATLATSRPDRRHFYARFFSGDLASLRPHLEANVHQACTEAANALPELCKDRQESPFPKDFRAFQLGSSDALSRDLLRAWGPGTAGLDMPAFFESLGLQPGQDVAEIGAQDGYFSVPLARWLGPDGHLVVTEGDATLRDHLAFAAAYHELAEVSVVAEGPVSSGLAPRSVDRIFGCDHLRHLYAIGRHGESAGDQVDISAYEASLAAALRPGGRLVLIEHAERPSDDKALPAARLVEDLEAAGLRHLETSDRFAPLQMVLTFERPVTP